MKNYPFISISIFILIIGFILWILFINRGSDKFSLLFLKAILIPSIGGLIIILYDLLTPIPHETKEVPVIIIHNSTYDLAQLHGQLALNGSTHTKGYWTIDTIIKGWKAKVGNNPKIGNIKDFYLDLAELTFFHWYSQKFPFHWQMKRTWFQGISGGGGAETAQPDAVPKPSVIDNSQIRTLLSNNLFIANGIDGFYTGNIFLPPETSYRVIRKEGSRIFTCENRNISLTISMEYVGGGGIGASNLARLITNKYPGYDTEGRIRFVFEMKTKPLRKWSPLTEKEKLWVQELISLFDNDFGWGNIQIDLKKALTSAV